MARTQALRSPTRLEVAEQIAKSVKAITANRPALNADTKSRVWMEDLTSTITIKFVADTSNGQYEARNFNSIDDIADAFNLDDIEDLASEIQRALVDETVYACMDPFLADVYKERALIVRGDPVTLDAAYQGALMSI